MNTLIEILEARIAPAAVFTYTDLDGDKVTVQTSKGTNADLAAILTFSDPDPAHARQLQVIDLSANAAVFAGTNLNVLAKHAGSGDGLVNVGSIDASILNGGTALDVGMIKIKGDLGNIDAGDGVSATSACKGLFVRSLGRLSTISGAADLESDFDGKLNSLAVKTDVKDAFVHVTDSAGTNGKIGVAMIGGSIIGGASTSSGKISAGNGIGQIAIKGDLVGGAGTFSGSVFGETIGSLKIGHNVEGGSGTLSGQIGFRDMGSLTIGGSLIGGAGVDSGQIQCNGDLGPVHIGHDVRGGSGTVSGQIQANGKLASLTIGGSLIGAEGVLSGELQCNGPTGLIKIAHNIQGGSGTLSGAILGAGKLAGVMVGGSVIGGTNDDSGSINVGSVGQLGSIQIGHDLVGGSIRGSSGNLSRTGFIQSSGQIGSVMIGGSIIAGSDTSSGGVLIQNGSIRASDSIGSLTVKGALVGNSVGAFEQVIISARGQGTPGETSDVAIGRISIGGRVEFASILAGYDTNLNPLNGDAQIGAVHVGGDWIASNLVAGAQNTASGNVSFGDGNDASIGAGNPNIVAKIASIVIDGTVIGAPNPFFQTGFVAQQIGSFHAAAFVTTLTAGTDAPIPLGSYFQNVTLHEV